MSAQHEPDVSTGQLGAWLWAEHRGADLWCSDVVRALSSFFIGFRGVCTSWDSGKLDPIASGMPAWQVNGEHAVSPPIDRTLAESWPGSSCGFDEWYFLASIPEPPTLHALCSWGVSVGEAADLCDVPSGFDLLAQLERYDPRAVLGDGRRVFLLTRDQA